MPNHNPPVPPSIEDIGLESHLNHTMADHNGYGYDEFIRRVGLKEPKTIIANAFNVTAFTIYKWLAIHEKESKRKGK